MIRLGDYLHMHSLSWAMWCLVVIFAFSSTHISHEPCVLNFIWDSRIEHQNHVTFSTWTSKPREILARSYELTMRDLLETVN